MVIRNNSILLEEKKWKKKSKLKRKNITPYLFLFIIFISYLLLNIIIEFLSFPIPEMRLYISDNNLYSKWLLNFDSINIMFKFEFMWYIFAKIIYFITGNIIYTFQIYNIICFTFISFGIYLITKRFVKNKYLIYLSGILFAIFGETYQLFGILRELLALCFLIYYIFFLFKLYNSKFKDKKLIIFLIILFILILFSHIFIVFIVLLISTFFSCFIIFSTKKDKNNLFFLFYPIILLIIILVKILNSDFNEVIFLSLIIGISISFISVFYFKIRKAVYIKYFGIVSLLCVFCLDLFGIYIILFPNSIIELLIQSYSQLLIDLQGNYSLGFGGGFVDGIVFWIFILIGLFYLMKIINKSYSSAFFIFIFLFPLILSYNEFYNIHIMSYRFSNFLTLFLPILLTVGLEKFLLEKKINHYLFFFIIFSIISVLIYTRFFIIYDYYLYYHIYTLLEPPNLLIMNPNIFSIYFLEITLFIFVIFIIGFIIIIYFNKKYKNFSINTKKLLQLSYNSNFKYIIFSLVLLIPLDFIEVIYFNQISFNWVNYQIISFFGFNSVSINFLLLLFDIRTFFLVFFVIYLIKIVLNVSNHYKSLISLLFISILFFPINPYIEPIALNYIDIFSLYIHLLFGLRFVIFSMFFPVYLLFDIFSYFHYNILPIGMYIIIPLITTIICLIFIFSKNLNDKSRHSRLIDYFGFYIILNSFLFTLYHTFLYFEYINLIIYPIIFLILFLIIGFIILKKKFK